MKRLATAMLLLAGLLAATSAMALDLHQKKTGVPSSQPKTRLIRNTVQAIYACDDGIASSAYFQGTDDRLGNSFNFGSGAVLSTVAFAHYGFGFSGPYNYDLEVWDPTSCTFIAAKNGLVAADAANDAVIENVDLCGSNLFVAGEALVAVDPNSCLSATDCYPDILFDDQVGVYCPYIIVTASTAPVCFDYSPYSGPFLLQVETDNCPTPAVKHSWGSVKTLYR